LLSPLDAQLVGWQGSARFPHTVFGIAAKAPVPAGFARAAGRFVQGMQQWAAGAAAREGWQRRLKRWGASWFINKSEHVRRREYHRVEFVLDLPHGHDWRRELLQLAEAEGQTGSRIDLA
ncbi:MAG TPA: hypothetical protein VGX76_02250, partial [Pirellulales bacterium]|nr:hypothetical protein [Pirellulales bacterium]